MMLPRRGQSGRLPARAEDDEVQATPPRSSSPIGTRGGDEGQESSDSGTQGSEGSDSSSQDSRQSALPAEDPQQRTSKVEEAPSDSRARWQRQSATSPKQQHHEQPRPAGSPGTGAPPPWRSTSQSVDVRLEQARRRKTAARETIVRRRHRLQLNQRRVDDAETEDREASEELRRAEWAVAQQARTDDSGAVASPHPRFP